MGGWFAVLAFLCSLQQLIVQKFVLFSPSEELDDLILEHEHDSSIYPRMFVVTLTTQHVLSLSIFVNKDNNYSFLQLKYMYMII